MRSPSCAGGSGQGPPERVHRPAARPLARRSRALALPALRAGGLVRKLARGPRHRGAVRPAGDGDRDDIRLDPLRRARGRPDAGDRRRAGAGRAHARCERLADVLADHAAVHSVGCHLRRDPHHRTLPRRVRRRRRRVGRLQGQTETATLRVQERYESFDLAGAYAISIVLATMAILVLVAMTVIRPRKRPPRCRFTCATSPSGSATSSPSTTSRSRSRAAL